MSEEKELIAGIMGRKRAYYASNAFGYFKNQSETVISAVEQKYRPYEQTTRTGFYLATMIAQYEAMMDSFTQTYLNAKPLFLVDSKRMGNEDLALTQQYFLNMVWESMGRDQVGGLPQWMRLVSDVPLYSMAVSYVRWNRQTGLKTGPVMQQGANYNFLAWTEEADVLQDEPELERIHPYNWGGRWDSGYDLDWEFVQRRWRLQDIMALPEKKNYKKSEIEELIGDLKKRKGERDPDFHDESEQANYANTDESVFQDVVEYWGPINHIRSYEDDPREYQIICDEKRIYLMEVNNIPGYRPIRRVTASNQNDSPYGRSLLAPTLPHAKILNLGMNLLLDDAITRIHNGWAVWPNYLKNPDEFANPEGTNPMVWMEDNAPVDRIPKRIGGESSGIARDLRDGMSLINTDKERAGQSDTGLGARPQKDQTATATMKFAEADSRRIRSAITHMGVFGLIPIAKKINLLALRNIPEIDRRRMTYNGEAFQVTDEEAVELWNNNLVDIHDSVLDPQENQAMKLEKFLNVTKDIVLQDPRGLPYLYNLCTSIGRKWGIPNVEHYFPEDIPPQVSPSQGQPGSLPISPPGQPVAASPEMEVPSL